MAVADFQQVIRESKTILWNGPMGVFEMEKFANGKFKVAEAIAEGTVKTRTPAIGGGDSRLPSIPVSAISVSTGEGGALQSAA